MKKFILNGSSLAEKEIYGVQRFTLELLKELDLLVEPNYIDIVVPKNGYAINKLKFKNIKVVETCELKHKKLSRFLWNQIGFVRYVKKKDGISIDLSLELSLFGNDIVCIHDCIRELFPENAVSFFNKIARHLYILQVKRNVKKAKYLLTVSECAKNDIRHLYKVPDDKKFDVIPNGWQHFEKIKADHSILEKINKYNQEYFFSLGSRSIHKNFKWIVEAAKQNPQYLFIVSGTNAVSKSDALLEKDAPQNIKFTGYLSDGEIKALMENCKAFIQPSFYEGFGIPPMEAMSCGAKCIVSNTSSLPEIYGKSVWYIEPSNYTDINLDEIMATEIEDNSKVLDSYSWKNSAHKLYNVLKNY